MDETTLQDTIDHVAITRLQSAYADIVTRRSWAELETIFLPDASGRRPCHGDDVHFRDDPAWKDLLLFHEYFHGDTGRGVGASHQTGWTALIIRCMNKAARASEE